MKKADYLYNFIASNYDLTGYSDPFFPMLQQVGSDSINVYHRDGTARLKIDDDLKIRNDSGKVLAECVDNAATIDSPNIWHYTRDFELPGVNNAATITADLSLVSAYFSDNLKVGEGVSSCVETIDL